MKNNKKILITGTAGFIGFHVAKYFLNKEWNVIGLDGITDYYDINIKLDRHNILSEFKNFKKFEFLIEDFNKLKELLEYEKPDIIIHLAAQAGVRYSIKNPKAYLDSNIVGTFNILDIIKSLKVKHLLISSTSSVYGDNIAQPFQENEKTDYPLSFYAATKKSCEVLAHSYSYKYNLPITIFRFFTVYGPWGRPDMALFKFTKSILNNEKIDIYNHGKMSRDFTYIDDLVDGIYKISKKIPNIETKIKNKNDSISKFAPYRIVNIGGSSPTELMYFVKLIEKSLGINAKKNFIDNQIGDVKSTWSDTSLIESLVRFKPKTSIEVGIKKFISWYKKYYEV